MYRRNITYRFVEYLMRTLKQKLYAVAMVMVGIGSAMILDGDATLLVLMLIFAVPMFVSSENWIV